MAIVIGNYIPGAYANDDGNVYLKDGALKCAWTLLCANPAVGTVPHPILGTVAVCRRCADKTGRTATLDGGGK